MRILLDPTADIGSGTGTETAKAAETKETAAAKIVTMTEEKAKELFQAAMRLELIEKERAAELARKEEEKLKEQAKRGEVEEAFSKYKSASEAKIAMLQKTILDGRLEAEVANALAGVKWKTPEAAGIALKLVRDTVKADYDQSGNVVVRDALGRPAADAIKEWLASPTAALMIEPANKGGSGSQGSTTPPAADQPKSYSTMGEFYLEAIQKQRQESRKTVPFQF
jgi:hypothetical protein